MEQKPNQPSVTFEFNVSGGKLSINKMWLGDFGDHVEIAKALYDKAQKIMEELPKQEVKQIQQEARQDFTKAKEVFTEVFSDDVKTCPTCGLALKYVKAGISTKNNQPYPAFWACPNRCPKKR